MGAQAPAVVVLPRKIFSLSEGRGQNRLRMPTEFESKKGGKESSSNHTMVLTHRLSIDNLE